MRNIVENIGSLHIINIIAENVRRIQYNGAIFRTTSLESVKCSLALRNPLWRGSLHVYKNGNTP